MKLLICTQTVDRDDPVSGFFHGWILALAKRAQSIEVVCLQKGHYDFPSNVRVHSLGKSAQGRPASGWGRLWLRVRYAGVFLMFVWRLRKNYDRVLVHQNQEYVLIAGWLWKFLSKKIYLWRNHYAGSLFTDIASIFCSQIFCTSKVSYTTRYSKTKLLPVGVDIELFHEARGTHKPNSILFLGRIAPSKHPDMFVEALGILASQHVEFTASIYGSALPKDYAYRTSLEGRLKELRITDRVVMRPGVPHDATSALYATHEIYVNLSASGMYDKTLFEAAASGCLVVARSSDFAQGIDEKLVLHVDTADELARILKNSLAMRPEEKQRIVAALRQRAIDNSLGSLVERLMQEMSL